MYTLVHDKNSHIHVDFFHSKTTSFLYIVCTCMHLNVHVQSLN